MFSYRLLIHPLQSSLEDGEGKAAWGPKMWGPGLDPLIALSSVLRFEKSVTQTGIRVSVSFPRRPCHCELPAVPKLTVIVSPVLGLGSPGGEGGCVL